ncbi:uncharacterized protein THITE_2145336 [Thermothielavioides terrestris NRRL 8126]|uniref:Uncharacterized protein n=1 Tax=Thermothielavioides terrestris (strain ATCC 38088 / NRRL 8126) TaxID=578455 RepID=G2R844_THETT|nr:uncharacterized protein THITE_2145336 [Thermothielavioides terrestris NRRL 8126]AEO68103.1 hypothetical protein THITE_2145336 [Thermothielavioides terrestris NRRL 8126]
MSGRSAYARKKATERTPARARSNASSDNATTGGLGELVGGPVPRQDRARYREMDAAGTKTANARPRDLTGLPEMDDMAVYYNGDHNNGGRSGSSLGERSAGPHASRGNRPLDDSAHARPPRLTLKTDYVSGIEKSGLRNALDKKSDELATTDRNRLPLCRWIGAGRPPQRWNKLRKDPELWDPHGDVLVFLGQRGQPSLDPSFRLSSHIIEATESRYLIAMLREGSTEDDLDTPSPLSGAPPMLQRHGSSGRRRLAPGGYGHRGQPTPPASEDNSLWNADGQISYELHFPAPSDSSARDQVRYHITTRNVFALLYHASLVGFSLRQHRLDSPLPLRSGH